MKREELESEIKEIIIKSLDLEDMSADDIETQAPLFGEGLSLDSIDALEIGMALKRKYNITLDSDKEKNKEHFYSIDTLSKFVRSKING